MGSIRIAENKELKYHLGTTKRIATMLSRTLSDDRVKYFTYSTVVYLLNRTKHVDEIAKDLAEAIKAHVKTGQDLNLAAKTEDMLHVICQIHDYRGIGAALYYAARSFSSDWHRQRNSYVSALVMKANPEWCDRLFYSMFNHNKTLDVKYKTKDTVSLANVIKEQWDFSAIPILADALEELGYEDDILQLMRNESEFASVECWAVHQLRLNQ